MDEELHFSIIGTNNVTKSFLPLINKGKEKKMIYISSILGSIEQGGTWPGLNDTYAICKAAMNMLIRKTALIVKQQGVTVQSIHPGRFILYTVGSQERRVIANWISRLGSGHRDWRQDRRMDE